MPAQRFPSVEVLSERPASNGRSVQGLSGAGIIMTDEPEHIYVSSKPGVAPEWYGRWPIQETSVPALRIASAAQLRERQVSEPIRLASLEELGVFEKGGDAFDSPVFKAALEAPYDGKDK
jgi:hypothetical protein